MNATLQRIHAGLTTMHGQRALVLWRVITGCTILAQLLAALPQRHFLFGPHGVYPADAAAQNAVFGLFSVVESNLGFELLYFGTIAVAVLWTLGVLTPLTTVAVLVCWRSTFDRLPGLGDGGDNLTQLLLVYSLLCNIGGPGGSRLMRRVPAWLRDVRALVHNTGLVAFWVQVSIVYFIAGAAKMHGESWRNGTALYYALSTDRYTIDGLVDPLLASPILLTVLAYATVVFQVGFPFMVGLNRYSRRLALLIATGFHLGIASVMGLTSFALFMIAADLTLLTDAEVSNLAGHLRRVWRAVRDRFGNTTTTKEKQQRKKT